MYQTRITAAELPVERLLGEYCFPERFREACRACPDYGNDWSCPPGVPAAAEALRPFRTAHVLGMQVFYDAQTRREVSTACLLYTSAGLSLPRAATRAAPTGGDVRGQAGISPAL